MLKIQNYLIYCPITGKQISVNSKKGLSMIKKYSKYLLNYFKCIMFLNLLGLIVFVLWVELSEAN